MTAPHVTVVGAGLAGLCCARSLQRAGIECTVLESSDAVGGRVRTDSVEGFRLDHGFQVLLTAYPECREVLDYDALDLRRFAPGALIRLDGRFCRLADPWRQPARAVETLLSPAGSLSDKLRIGLLRRRLRRRSLDAIFRAPELTTLDYLRRERFSPRIVEAFFRPFVGGVFLDPDLETTSRMFEFVFKMFAAGDVAVPNRGMQAIPESIAEQLRPGSVRTRCRVERIRGTTCELSTGEQFQADFVAVATDGAQAARLIDAPPPQHWNATTCLYFDAPQAPIGEPILILNGEGQGPINSVTVMSRVAPGYAPAGRSLVSVNLLGGGPGEAAEAEAAVRGQLTAWFGAPVAGWRLLGRYSIERALPFQPPGVLEPAHRPVRVREGLYVCGDHVEQGSIQGAMVAGRRAAEAILDDIGR